MTTTSPSPAPTSLPARAGAAEPQRFEPPRWQPALALGFLALGFAVDLAQFSHVVGLAAAGLSDPMRWLIAVGAGAVALYMMVEAGRQEAMRRERTRGKHGRGIIRLVIGVWLLLGLAATYIRLTVPPAGSASTGGFGSAAASGGGFGGAGAAATEVTYQLGSVTIYAAEVPLALLMLVLYLAVGIGAYLFGLHSHDPRLTELRRARGAESRARERLRHALTTHDERQRRVVALQYELGQIDQQRVSERIGGSLTTSLEGHRTSTAQRDRLATELSAVREQLAQVDAELGGQPSNTTAQKALAAAAGTNAREHARALLHQHLADPARTVKGSDSAAHRPDPDPEA